MLTVLTIFIDREQKRILQSETGMQQYVLHTDAVDLSILHRGDLVAIRVFLRNNGCVLVRVRLGEYLPI